MIENVFFPMSITFTYLVHIQHSKEFPFDDKE